MHESIFSYNLSKPYPFRWVTPVVVVGGIVALVLFSVLNFASSGYTLVSEYSTNPNLTTEHWFDKRPSSLRSKIRPTCPPSAIPINTQLYTNNTALVYTLGIVKPVNSDVVSLPSLIYSNNPLVDCKVESIQMSFEMLGRTANQMAKLHWGLDVQGVITCTVHGPIGAMNITLNTDYNYIPPTVSTYSGQYQFPCRNATHSASLWWGESLLSFLYLHLISVLNDAIGDQNKMSLSLTRNETSSSPSLSNEDYFTVLERDMTIYTSPKTRTEHDGIIEWSDPGFEGLNGLIYRVGWIREENSTFPNLIANTTGPNIWPIVDRLAKSFESTILTDLGQVDARPNVLIDASLLQNYTADIAALYENNTQGGTHGSQGGPATASLDSTLSSQGQAMGPLVVRPSTLAINYLCQIPRRKPTGDLVLSVLVADLVFLQALWLLFTFCIGQYVMRKDNSTSTYAGCAAPLSEGEQRSIGRQTRYEKLSGVETTNLEADRP